MAASCWIAFSKSFFVTMLEVSKFLILVIIEEKFFSSLLSLLMDHLLILILIPWIPISTVTSI